MQIEWKWFDSLEGIPKEVWNNIFGHKIMKSHEFFMAMQYSNIPNSSFMYLVIYKNDSIITILPCFQYKLDLGILAPRIVKRMTSFFRKLYSSVDRKSVV